MIKINGSYLISIALMFITFCGFFRLPLNVYALLNIVMIFGIIIVIYKRKIQICLRNKKGWIIYLSALIFSLSVSASKIESAKYLLFFMNILVSAYIMNGENGYKWYKIFIIICIIETFFIIFQYYMPSIVNNLSSVLLPTNLYKSTIDNFNLGSYSGIAADLPNALFFAMSVIFFGVVNYLEKKENIFLALTLIGVFGVFLSGKRSGLIILVIAMVLIYILFCIKSNSFDYRVLLFMAIFTVVFLYILYFTPLGEFYSMKNELLNSSGDISNGRTVLNKEMIDIFKDRPIFGIGQLGIESYHGSALGHNIYYQTLAENGIYGFIALISLVLLNLKKVYNKYKNSIEKEESIKYLLSFGIQIFFIVYGFFGNPLYGFVFLIPYIIFAI